MNRNFTNIYKVFLKGSAEALSQAFRRTLVYLARFEQEYGEESIPRYFKFEIDEIDGYRVISLMTDGTGYAPEYSDIPGLTECWWILYSQWPEIADTNDEVGIILSRKELFGIPDANYTTCQ